MSLEALREEVGRQYGPGGWVTVTQAMIAEFADLTGDHQWIHLDEERCRRESPYGTTVAHGMLVQSLIPRLLGEDISWLEDFSGGVNYGSDKVRFTAPVPSGSRIRATWVLKEVAEIGKGSVRIVHAITISVEGSEKPACYAELVGLLFP
jgi:acyl dehydratase